MYSTLVKVFDCILHKIWLVNFLFIVSKLFANQKADLRKFKYILLRCSVQPYFEHVKVAPKPVTFSELSSSILLDMKIEFRYNKKRIAD